MKRRKILLLTAGLGVLLVMGTTGCGKEAAETEAPVQIQNTSLEEMEEGKSEASLKDTGEEPETKQETAEGENSADVSSDTDGSVKTEPLSGKIQKIDENGMVIAQTTVWDDREGGSGVVTLVDEAEAEKVSVRFAGDVKVEYWKIEGGGADIDMQDRTLADLEVGVTVEMEGCYEGDIYVATKIIMEEYV